MELALWFKGFAGAALGAAIICNLPTRLWMAAEKATLPYLAETTLQTLEETGRKFKEARELSSLKPQLSGLGFNLYAVVHEVQGVKEFQPFFDGEIFLDAERRFYGPKERWMFLSGFIRPSVWKSIFRAKGKEIEGNLKGEGRILGGVFVVGTGDQGVLLEHRESEFGDHANLTSILEAAQNAKNPDTASSGDQNKL